MTYSYKTKGTCSKEINIKVDDENTIVDVEFVGGCPGNTLGISTLVKGMKIDDVIQKLSGLRCGLKTTSCPDQLSRALTEIKKQQNN